MIDIHHLQARRYTIQSGGSLDDKRITPWPNPFLKCQNLEVSFLSTVHATVNRHVLARSCWQGGEIQLFGCWVKQLGGRRYDVNHSVVQEENEHAQGVDERRGLCIACRLQNLARSHT